MADFEIALQKTLNNEGEYACDKDDPGGETYKGIARNFHGTWEGWITIDLLKKQSGFPANLDKNQPLQELIKDFYRNNFWNPAKGNEISNQLVAESIFDFAVNAGVATSAVLTQMVVGAVQDGVIGGETITALNQFDADHFLASFTIAKIARYVSIVKKRPLSQKYFFGWVRRALGDY